MQAQGLDFCWARVGVAKVACVAVTRWGAGGRWGAGRGGQVQERQSFTLKLSSPTFERDRSGAAADAADESVAVSCLVSEVVFGTDASRCPMLYRCCRPG